MTIQDKRKELKQISAPFLALKKEGAIESINGELKKLYAAQGHTELKTLREWNKENKRVRKGEHSILLWGKPKLLNKNENIQTEDNSEEDTFFPICFLFSNLQVEDKK